METKLMFFVTSLMSIFLICRYLYCIPFHRLFRVLPKEIPIKEEPPHFNSGEGERKPRAAAGPSDNMATC